MANKVSQKPIEVRRRKVASRLALAEATRGTDRAECVGMYKDMGFSDSDAKTAAKALEGKYFADLKRSILAEAGFEGSELDGHMANEADETADEEAAETDEVQDLEDEEGLEEPLGEEEDFDTESDELAMEDDMDMPGDGEEVVEEIDVPGGKLKITFEPSDGSEELPVSTEPEGVCEECREFPCQCEEGEELGTCPGCGSTPCRCDEDEGLGDEGMDMGSEPMGARPMKPMKSPGGMGRMPGKEKLLAAREAERQKIIASANRTERRRILSELVNEPAADTNKDKNLGDDTAHSGDGRESPSTKAFKMVNTKGLKTPVAGPGETGKTMTLQNDGGNSLKSDPDYLYFDTPAKAGTVLQQENARGKMTLEGVYGDLAKQEVSFADANVPSEGGAGFPEFEVPTQLDTAKQRKVTVASNEDEEGQELTLEEVKKDGKLRAAFEFLRNKKFASQVYSENEDEKVLRRKVANRECDAYEDNEEAVRIVECEDCGGRFVLSQSAYQDEYCPGCRVTIAKATELSKEATINREMWNKDYGSELCEAEGNSVTRDPNGDGGFKTQGKKGGSPKDKNARDMELDAGEYEKVAENEVLRKMVSEGARNTEAYRTAAKLVEAGVIDASEIQEHVGQMLSEGMTVEAIRLYGEQSVKIAGRTRKSAASEKTVKTASSGLAQNFSMATVNSDETQELSKLLANSFTTPKSSDYGDDGRRLQRR